MEALARDVEMFPDDAAARSYFLAHADTLRKSVDPVNGIHYTITPQPDGSVVGTGTCSHYNVLAADVLALAYRWKNRVDYLDAARRCFAYGVKNANGQGASPTYFQVHSANGAMHGNIFMTVTRSPAAASRRHRGRQWIVLKLVEEGDDRLVTSPESLPATKDSGRPSIAGQSSPKPE